MQKVLLKYVYVFIFSFFSIEKEEIFSFRKEKISVHLMCRIDHEGSRVKSFVKICLCFLFFLFFSKEKEEFFSFRKEENSGMRRFASDVLYRS